MFQQLFEIARCWNTATDEDVATLKQYVSRIVGYDAGLLKCECTIWHTEDGLVPEDFFDIYVLDVNHTILDHLHLHPEGGFRISRDYDEFDGIPPPTKEHYLQMMSVIDEIRHEEGLPLPDQETLERRNNYKPDTFFADMRKDIQLHTDWTESNKQEACECSECKQNLADHSEWLQGQNGSLSQ